MNNSSKFSFSTVIIQISAALLVSCILSGCVNSYTPPLQAKQNSEHTALSIDDDEKDVENVSLKQENANSSHATTSTHTARLDPSIPLSVEIKQIPGLYKTNSDMLLLSWDQLIEQRYIYLFGRSASVNPDHADQLQGDLVIPSGIASVDFMNCTELTNITLPQSIATFASCAFLNCRKIQNVYYTGTVADWCRYSFYSSSSPCYYGANLYLDGQLAQDIVIPGSVTSIGNYLFYYCDTITSVTIESGVRTIGNSAFANCRNMQSISIPNTVAIIEGAAFFHCSSLESVTLPSSVTSLGKGAFSTCTSLTHISLPPTIAKLDNDIFYRCTSLQSIHIPVTVTWIGSSAFAGCSSLASVTYGGTKSQWNNIAKGAQWDKDADNLKVKFTSP